MKNLLQVLVLLLITCSLLAQDLRESEVSILSMGGYSAFEYEDSNPWGKIYSLGFQLEVNNLLYQGTLYEIRYLQDLEVDQEIVRVLRSFTGVSFGIGQRIFDRGSITFGLTYAQPEDQADGFFGFYFGPQFELWDFGRKDQFSVVSRGYIQFQDELFAWNGLIGLSWNINK